MDIRKLLTKFDSLTEGSMARAKKNPTGPKFPGYLKGTDPASLTHSRMVGSSESQETVLRDLERELVEGAVERKLKEEFAEFDHQQLDELNLFKKKPKAEPVKVPDDDYRQLFNKDPVSFASHHPLDVKHYHNSRDYHEKTGINPLDAKRPVKELAVSDGGDDGFDDNTLKHLAAQWWNGDEDSRIERTLMAAGWEIGRDEGYDNGGAFVIQTGDVDGDSYQSWPAEELEELAEGIFGSNKPPEDKKEKLTLAAMRKIEQELADRERQDPKFVRSNDLPRNPDHRRTVTDEEKADKVELPPPENARKTQIAGTLPTYKKAADIIAKTGVRGKALDFGAGLGHGTRELGKQAHSYEPFPGENFKPHFVDVDAIPDNAYHKIVNLNVLNVVPNAGKQRIRDNIVRNIGRVLAPGGVAIITTRGKDVLTIKGTPGEEPMSMISKIGTYQKGFTASELQQYVQDLLGDEFTVSRIKLGPAGIMIKKHKEGVAEGWKDKVAGGALALGALGGIGALQNVAPNVTVQGQQYQLAMPGNIPDNAKLVTTDDGKKVYVWKTPGYKNRVSWSYRPVEQVKEQGVAEADDEMFAPSNRAANQIAAGKWRRGGELTGTSLKGYIETTYEQLKSVFGDPYYGPNDEDSDKITCEWIITFGDGKVATIYDWKTEATPDDLYDWHIGGSDRKVVDYIGTLMSGKGSTKSSLWEGIDEDSAMETRIYNTNRVNVYYKPHHNSRHSRAVAENIPAKALDALLAKLASKFDVSTTDFVWSPVEQEQIDEVGMTTGGMPGMTGGGTAAQPQATDPAQAAKDLTMAQQNLNKLKSAGIALPAGVSQAAKTVVGVTNNPTAPQTPADKKTTGALGQGIEQLLAKGDPGQVNQLAAMIKKVQQGGPQ